MLALGSNNEIKVCFKGTGTGYAFCTGLPPIARAIMIGLVGVFPVQGVSSQTALLAGKMEPLSESSTATSSWVEAMCGTTSSTPLAAALVEKDGLWRGGRGRATVVSDRLLM